MRTESLRGGFMLTLRGLSDLMFFAVAFIELEFHLDGMINATIFSNHSRSVSS
jgi:hypothetical protein